MLNISESKRKKCQDILSSTDTAFNKFCRIFDIYKSEILGTELYYAALGLIDSDRKVDTGEFVKSAVSSTKRASDEVHNMKLYQEYEPWLKVGTCAKCGGDIEVDTSKILTSYPPKYRCTCKKCGNITYLEV